MTKSSAFLNKISSLTLCAISPIGSEGRNRLATVSLAVAAAAAAAATAAAAAAAATASTAATTAA